MLKNLTNHTCTCQQTRASGCGVEGQGLTHTHLFPGLLASAVSSVEIARNALVFDEPPLELQDLVSLLFRRV